MGREGTRSKWDATDSKSSWPWRKQIKKGEELCVRFGDGGDGIDVYEARLTKERYEFIEIVG